MTINQFFKECHKREIFKSLSIYIVSGWVILQVLSVIWKPLGLPDKSVTILIIGLLIGFPIYILYIWKSRLKYSVATDLNDPIEVKNRKNFERYFFTSFAIISFFSAVSVFWIFNNSYLDKMNLAEFSGSDKIAVLNFKNNTGDTNYDQIGKLAMNWILHSITENKVGQVITEDILANYAEAIQSNSSGITSSRDILKTFLQPSEIVEGSYFLKNNNLVLNGSIVDGNSGDILFSFQPVECDSESPFDCIEELNQLLLGYLISESSDLPRIAPTPPKYEAYKIFMEAQSIYGFNNDLYLELLNKAIEIDSNYFDALVNKVMYYVNRNDFKTADSLRLTILPQTGHTSRMKNLMNYYQATIKGNNRKIYETYLKEYEVNPFNIRTNQTQMTLALQAINKPELVKSFYDELPNDEFDLENCTFCMYRVYTKAIADIELGDYYKAFDLLETAMRSNDHVLLRKAAVTTYVRTNDIENLTVFLDQMQILSDAKVWEECNLLAGKEILLNTKDKELANRFFTNVIEASTDKTTRNVANAYYYKRDFKKAEELYKKLLVSDPESLNHLSKLAISLFANGKDKESSDIINRINSLRSDYDLGYIDYAMAQIFSSRNDMKSALEYLKVSVARGRWYTQETFKNDFHFNPVINSPEFDEIMNFWNKGL